MTTPSEFAAAVLAISLATGAAGAATGTAPADPWTQVSALPTACYGNQDDFSEVSRARIESISHEIERQQAVNTELSQRFSDMDFTEKRRRMSEYMMQHPQESGKIMEAFQAAGTQQANDARLQAAQQGMQQRSALDATFTRYRAAYEAAIGPIIKRIGAVPKDLAPWDSPEKKPFNVQADQEYGKLCAQWWKSGPFLAQLAEYRKSLVQGIPEQNEQARLVTTNFAWAGIPATAYRSTATMEAVKQYLERAVEIFGKRDETASHRE